MYLPSHTIFQDSHLFLTPSSNFIDIFLLAILNGLFFSISLSPPLLIAFRTLVFQGVPAGVASYLGIGLGQILFLLIIYSGFTSVIDFWYSFEPFLFILGSGISIALFLYFYNQSLYLDTSRQKIKLNDISNLFKISGIQFLLILCNPSVAVFHLVSFPINQSSFSALFFMLFFISFLLITFIFHYFLLYALEQLSKFATYVPVKGSIFETKAPFSNRVNNFICLLGSILIFASLTQYQWRLFFQYADGPAEMLSARKLHLDYKIDLNKDVLLDFPNIPLKLKKNINVNYKSRPIKSKAISPIPNYGFNLYNQNQLVEKPRVRYLIQLDSANKAESSFDLKDIKNKGSNRGLKADRQRFESFVQSIDSQQILWDKPSLFSFSRKGNKHQVLTSNLELAELESFAKVHRAENLPEAAYKRYYINPLKNLQVNFLNAQISLQKPFSQKLTGEELIKLQSEEARLFYKLAIAEIGTKEVHENYNPKLPLDDRRIKLKRIAPAGRPLAQQKADFSKDRQFSTLTQPLLSDPSALEERPTTGRASNIYMHSSLQ